MSHKTTSMLARYIATVRRFFYSTSPAFSQNPKYFFPWFFLGEMGAFDSVKERRCSPKFSYLFGGRS
jgi:hypothetical protein